MATRADVRRIALSLPLLASDPEKFFTEPHYNGFPAVLVVLAEVGRTELRELLVDAWRCQAPRTLVAEYDARRKR